MSAQEVKDVAGQGIDIIAKIITDASGKSTDLAKTIAHAIVNKPWVGLLMAKLGKAGIAWIKAGGLTKFVADFAAAKSVAGISAKQALTTALGKQGIGVSARGFAEAGAVGKTGVILRGAASIVGIIAAIQIAKKTVDAAAAQAENKWDAFAKNPNAKTGWELFWETTIPVATFRWIESAVKKHNIHATPEVQGSNETAKESKLNASSGISSGSLQERLRRQYDQAAKAEGMVDRPSHPIAEREWQKEVERRMSKTKNSKLNSPDWYFQGLASKLMGTTLTWSGIKGEGAGYPFVAATALHVNLTIPTDESAKLHNQIISNTNIEYQALRGKNTGAFNYGELEVYKYNIALSSAIAVYRYVGKLLNMVNVHDPEVDNLNTMLIACAYNSMATNVNTGKVQKKDFIDNLPLYVTRLNAIGKDLNTYALKGCTLISRWNYLADKCIRDYSGSKAVYGYYALRYVPSLDANGDLQYVDISGETMPNLLTYLETQLNNIRTVASGTYPKGVLLKVAGDMIKLLGAGKETFNNVPYFTGNEVYKFEFDPEAFDQIKNAKMIPWRYATMPTYDRATAMVADCTIETTTGAQAISSTGNLLIQDSYILTSDRKVEFSHKENLQLIQFYMNCKSLGNAGNGHKIAITAQGTSTLDHFTIAEYDGSGDPQTDTYTSFVTQYNGADTKQVLVQSVIPTLHGTSGGKYTEWNTRIAQIDFMPRFQICFVNASTASFYALNLDVDNYSHITRDQFNMLNNVAVYSQFFKFNPEDVKIVGLLS